jgi:hypothetical protein
MLALCEIDQRLDSAIQLPDSAEQKRGSTDKIYSVELVKLVRLKGKKLELRLLSCPKSCGAQEL